MTTRDAQAIQTRRKLVDSMKALMGERDYEAIRIADIARAAEVSVGTFYLYFKSKTDIVTEVARGLNEGLTNDLSVMEDERVEAQFLRYCDRYLETVLRDGFRFSRGNMIAMIQGAIGPGDIAVERQRAYLCGLVERGVATGELRGGEVSGAQFAEMFLSAINGTILAWCFSANDESVLVEGMENVKRLFGLLKRRGE